jgi:hypothetical protein
MGSTKVISEPMKPGPNGLSSDRMFLECSCFQQVIDIGFGIFLENLRENPLNFSGEMLKSGG